MPDKKTRRFSSRSRVDDFFKKEHKGPISPLMRAAIADLIQGDIPPRVLRMMRELIKGFQFLKRYPNAATIFGSSRSSPQSPEYKEAYKLGYQFAHMGFTVITGGGGGIMEAANKGAHKAKGASLGINIHLPKLPKGEVRNAYVSESRMFKYFFVRKVMMAFASKVYVFFPGGLGTLDEFYEMMTLVQTFKIEPIPILAVDIPGRSHKFWKTHFSWLQEVALETYQTISPQDLALVCRVRSADEASRHIKKLIKKGVITL